MRLTGARQALLGLLVAGLSTVLLAGSLTLALVESGSALTQQTETDEPLPVYIEAEATETSRLNLSQTSSQTPGTGTAESAAPASPTLSGTTTDTPIATAQKTTRPEIQTAPVCDGPPAGWVPYFVRSGDTLYRLSLQSGASVSQIMSANCLTSVQIRTGDLLYLPWHPAPTMVYPAVPPGVPPLQTATPPPAVVPPLSSPSADPLPPPPSPTVEPPVQTSLPSTEPPAPLPSPSNEPPAPPPPVFTEPAENRSPSPIPDFLGTEQQNGLHKICFLPPFGTKFALM